MKFFSARPWQSVLFLIVLAPLFFDGCVSIGVSRSMAGSSPSGAGSLEVGIFEKSDDTKLTARRIVTQLVRLESRIEKPVYESDWATWSLDDLSPGRYRLRIVRWIDETGRVRNLSNNEQESFKIRAGESVQARVVLKEFPTGTVVTIAVIGGVAIATAVILSALRGFYDDAGMLELCGRGRSHTDKQSDRRQKEQLRTRVRSFR